MARAASGVLFYSLISKLANGHVLVKVCELDMKFTWRLFNVSSQVVTHEVCGDWHEAAYELEDMGMLVYDNKFYRLSNYRTDRAAAPDDSEVNGG